MSLEFLILGSFTDDNSPMRKQEGLLPIFFNKVKEIAVSMTVVSERQHIPNTYLIK